MDIMVSKLMLMTGKRQLLPLSGDATDINEYRKIICLPAISMATIPMLLMKNVQEHQIKEIEKKEWTLELYGQMM